MNEKTEPYVVDRTGWNPGPWEGEPDRVDFEHAGLPCLMLRHPWYGNWCGYAAVPPGHPLYRAAIYPDIEVHGGLTYAHLCGGYICHVPKPGEPDNVFWFGFDCGHIMDYQPGLEAIELSMRIQPMQSAGILKEVYRDAQYVRGQVQDLAEQLAAWTGDKTNQAA